MSRRRTTRQIVDDFETPTIEPPHQIARVLGPRGKNLHEVEWVGGKTTLVTLPPKFRNLIWVKRGASSFGRSRLQQYFFGRNELKACKCSHSGHFVVVDPTAGTTEKIMGEIVH